MFFKGCLALDILRLMSPWWETLRQFYALRQCDPQNWKGLPQVLKLRFESCDCDQNNSLQILKQHQIKADNQVGGTVVEKEENLCSCCPNFNDWQELGWKHRQEILDEKNLPGKKKIRSLSHINEWIMSLS